MLTICSKISCPSDTETTNESEPKWLRPIEKKVLTKLESQNPISLSTLAPNQSMLGAVKRLIKYNLLGYSSFTPTDANHILKKYVAILIFFYCN